MTAVFLDELLKELGRRLDVTPVVCDVIASDLAVFLSLDLTVLDPPTHAR